MGDSNALRRRIEQVEQELADSHQTIRAIATGKIDAVARQEGANPVLLEHAQDALRRSERLMRGIFDGSLDAILLADDQGRYVDANPAACELFGLTRDEMLGRRVADFAATPAEVPASWREFLQQDQQRGHFALRRADGARRVLEYSATANIIPGLHLSILRDVTDRLQAETRFQGLLESAPDAMVIVDGSGRICLVNRQTELLLGYAREELIGEPVEVLLPERFASAHASQHRAYAERPVTRSMGAVGRQLLARHKDGSEIPVEIWLSKGAGQTVIAAVRDVSARERANEALRQSEERYRRIIETTTEGVCILSREATITFMNARLAEMLGRTTQDALGRPIVDFMDPAELASAEAQIERLKQGVPCQFDFRLKRSDGLLFWVFVSATPLTDSTGQYEGALGMITDITERRQIEDARARLVAIAESAADGIIGVNLADGLITSWNTAAERLFGYSAEQAIGQHFAILASGANEGLDGEILQRVSRGETFTYEGTWRRPDGTSVELAHTVSPVRDGSGRVNALAAIVRDLTEIRRAEEALRASEEQYRAVFEGSPYAKWIVDLETFRFLEVNAAAARVYGYSREEFLGMTIRDIQFVAGEPPGLEEAPGKARVRKHRRKDGRPVEVRMSATRLLLGGRVVAAVVAEDVTETRALELRLNQAQKMEAVGRLAAGVAHDFNNLLSVVLSYADFIVEASAAGETTRSDAEEIRAAGRRGTSLTRQLLAFSRQQVLEPKVLEMNDCVAGVVPMLRRLLGEDIELVNVPRPEAGSIRIDPGQLEQVLMNLAVNARDAMPRGGRLTIETSRARVEEEALARRLEIAKADYAVLSVTDTGSGMDEATQARIFEPFFTTKETGKGTGLGLATVMGIVTQSGGGLEVVSTLGRGTSFRIYLPQCQPEVRRASSMSFAPATLVRPNAFETILVVEDEEEVRAVTMRILRNEGYHVLEASSPAQAMSFATSHPGAIDLLLTDVVMPHMGGGQLAIDVKAQRPKIKLVFMSGYLDDAVLRHGIVQDEVAFVAKPITPRALLAKVREVLRS